jgi:iron transport multicopper oxidase
MGNVLGSCPRICTLLLQVLWPLIHALKQGQYVDGLRAPLVLHRQEEAYAYDDEFTIVLGDWYHDEHSVLLKQFISIANPGGAEPVPSK